MDSERLRTLLVRAASDDIAEQYDANDELKRYFTADTFTRLCSNEAEAERTALLQLCAEVGATTMPPLVQKALTPSNAEDIVRVFGPIVLDAADADDIALAAPSVECLRAMIRTGHASELMSTASPRVLVRVLNEDDLSSDGINAAVVRTMQQTVKGTAIMEQLMDVALIDTDLLAQVTAIATVGVIGRFAPLPSRLLMGLASIEGADGLAAGFVRKAWATLIYCHELNAEALKTTLADAIPKILESNGSDALTILTAAATTIALWDVVMGCGERVIEFYAAQPTHSLDRAACHVLWSTVALEGLHPKGYFASWMTARTSSIAARSASSPEATVRRTFWEFVYSLLNLHDNALNELMEPVASAQAIEVEADASVRSVLVRCIPLLVAIEALSPLHDKLRAAMGQGSAAHAAVGTLA